VKQPRLLHRVGATPTPAAGILAPASTTLPPDLLRDARKRLGYVAILYGAGYAVAFFGTYLLAPQLLSSSQAVVATVSILLAAAVYTVSRFSRMSEELLLDFALVFQVAGAFGIAASNV
jgi:hypothetical protein